MKLLPQSNPARRIIRSGVIVVLLLAVLYGGFRWWEHRRQQWIEEFVRTTSLDNNPWGIERGMSESEVKNQLDTRDEGEYIIISGVSTVKIGHFPNVEYKSLLWDVHFNTQLEFDPTHGLSDKIEKLEVSFSKSKYADWIEWIKSYLPF